MSKKINDMGHSGLPEAMARDWWKNSMEVTIIQEKSEADILRNLTNKIMEDPNMSLKEKTETIDDILLKKHKMKTDVWFYILDRMGERAQKIFRKIPREKVHGLALIAFACFLQGLDETQKTTAG